MRYTDEVVLSRPSLTKQELQKSVAELEIKNYGHVCNKTIRFTSNAPRKLSRDAVINTNVLVSALLSKRTDTALSM